MSTAFSHSMKDAGFSMKDLHGNFFVNGATCIGKLFSLEKKIGKFV